MRVLDSFAGVGLKLRRSYGIVLPYLQVAVTGDWLMLDIDDLTFTADKQSEQHVPDAFSKPLVFETSTGPGIGLRGGAGVDFMILENFGLGLEISAYQVFHTLKKTTVVQNVATSLPYPSLTGFTVLAGATFQL